MPPPKPFEKRDRRNSTPYPDKWYCGWRDNTRHSSTSEWLYYTIKCCRGDWGDAISMNKGEKELRQSKDNLISNPRLASQRHLTTHIVALIGWDDRVWIFSHILLPKRDNLPCPTRPFFCQSNFVPKSAPQGSITPRQQKRSSNVKLISGGNNWNGIPLYCFQFLKFNPYHPVVTPISSSMNPVCSWLRLTPKNPIKKFVERPTHSKYQLSTGQLEILGFKWTYCFFEMFHSFSMNLL